ncbi:branched-chain amino acid ABC transporter permease [Aquincola tertiaricarbonis]|uniref:branched-chain amino acid ABC transporter permease n=1 Tax=Aquincola tertiaricarbonis TaxID=391953 RepID=UPI0006153CBB|nr:branched-chain amino acid ABC transporter permease [Aquincola tertiaricarbonis]
MRDALCTTDGGVGLATDLAVLSLLAISAWLVLRSGRISLGQQAFFAIGAYAAAIATTLMDWPLAPALLAAAALGAAASALVAGAMSRLSGLHYAVATLAFAELVRLGLSAWHWRVPADDGSQAGPDGVHGFRDIRWLLANGVTPEQFALMALTVLAIVTLALVLLMRTRFGLGLQAVGLDDTLADTSGWPAARLRVAAAALAGALAALGGGLYAHRTTFIDPAVFDPMLGVHAVGYALIGGLASVAGPLLGTALDLGLLEATRWFEGWRMVVFGGLVALFLRWRPRGLLDEATLAALRALPRRRTASPAATDRRSSFTTRTHP